MNGRYILNAAGEPEPAPDLISWVKWWMQADERHVALDTCDHWRVSTVFLGLDHNWRPGGAPLLFETMVFDEDGTDRLCQRYTLRSLALAGHQAAVALVQAKYAEACAATQDALDRLTPAAP